VKDNKIGYFLILSVILVLLVLLSPIPAYATGGTITPSPTSGRIGDWIKTSGGGFGAGRLVYIFFSSNRADEDDEIDSQVTAYERVLAVSTGSGGSFSNFTFIVPEALTDGMYEQEVHGGDYYLYATYAESKTIIGVVGFTVIGGEIELDPETGTVGTELEISGEDMRPNQQIAVEYDADEVDIISGDSETDGEGQFVCAVTIPESIAGSHIVAVIDESGDMPQAEFSVRPGITLDPSQQAVVGTVQVSGRGFGKNKAVILTFEGRSVNTTPESVETSYCGSFDCSFAVPSVDSCGDKSVIAMDEASYSAEAQLTVPASITFSPVITPASPGNVGMELTIDGMGFIAGAEVTVTYATDGEAIPVATPTVDDEGKLSVSFTVPPSAAGSHAVTATDGVTTATSIFTMESQAPPMPRVLLPEFGGTSGAEAYFDWEGVTDPSGVSYTLQVATDDSFTTIVLEKEGLPQSQYTLSEGEKLAGASYCWRVRAVDGASNEGAWSLSILFYIGFFRLSNWLFYVLFGLGVLILVIIIFWWRRQRVA
jgi:hypothetical protein